MCNIIEDPIIAERLVPASMPQTVGSLVDISVWVGLGSVGLWAALDAFADRAGLNGPQCPICKRKSCIAARYQGKLGQRLKDLEELDDIRNLYAHNAGQIDDKYFDFDPDHPRHVLLRGCPTQLTCGAQFTGSRLSLNLFHLRRYSCMVRGVLESFS
jgi:hypothetical protein